MRYPESPQADRHGEARASGRLWIQRLIANLITVPEDGQWQHRPLKELPPCSTATLRKLRQSSRSGDIGMACSIWQCQEEWPPLGDFFLQEQNPYNRYVRGIDTRGRRVWRKLWTNKWTTTNASSRRAVGSFTKAQARTENWWKLY